MGKEGNEIGWSDGMYPNGTFSILKCFVGIYYFYVCLNKLLYKNEIYIIYINDKMTKCLVVGDVHIRLDNLEDIQHLILRLEETIRAHTPDFIILLGDILHTHERIHTSCLQAAEKLFTMCTQYTITYALVGNHDYISNSQFLTSYHWMTPFKAWKNLIIVDTVVPFYHEHNYFIACPYVPDGRMVEALSTIPNWMEAHMIFGHQTLDGVHMGAIKTEHVEQWLPTYPFLCSGHIHDKQEVQPNLYYTGTPMQQSFGEKRNKSIVLFTIQGKDTIKEEIFLHISDKRIEYLTVQEAYSYQLTVKQNEHVRLTIRGSKEECKVFKKTTCYQKLSLQAKIVMDEIETEFQEIKEDHVFHDVLYKSIQSNYFLTQLYKKHANLPSLPEIEFI
jgi:DNA repair exonuclease SbcCD nuclease subunit